MNYFACNVAVSNTFSMLHECLLHRKISTLIKLLFYIIIYNMHNVRKNLHAAGIRK